MFDQQRKRFQEFRHRNKGLFSTKTIEISWGKLLTKPWLHRLMSAVWPQHKPKSWIVLVGSYNSGTTILKELISTHPDVASFHLEATRYTDIFKRPETLGWTRNWLKIKDYISLPDEQNPALYRQFLRDLSPLWNKRGRTYLEKSISNIERMGWIEHNFPNVRFVAIVRNGYAATEGMIRKGKPEGQAAIEYGADKYAFDFAGQQWEMGNRHLLANLKNTKQSMLIRYEDMVADPANTIRTLFEFLELDTAACRFEGQKVWVGNREFTLTNMNEKSFKVLKQADIEAFNKAVGPFMQELNYPLK